MSDILCKPQRNEPKKLANSTISVVTDYNLHTVWNRRQCRIPGMIQPDSFAEWSPEWTPIPLVTVRSIITTSSPTSLQNLLEPAWAYLELTSSSPDCLQAFLNLLSAHWSQIQGIPFRYHDLISYHDLICTGSRRKVCSRPMRSFLSW